MDICQLSCSLLSVARSLPVGRASRRSRFAVRGKKTEPSEIHKFTPCGPNFTNLERFSTQWTRSLRCAHCRRLARRRQKGRPSLRGLVLPDSPTPFGHRGFSGAVESSPFRARRSNDFTSWLAWLRASVVEPYALHNVVRSSPNIDFEALRSSRASAARPSRCLAFTVGFSYAPPCFVHFAVARERRRLTTSPSDLSSVLPPGR